jgi:hypothetical protein
MTLRNALDQIGRSIAGSHFVKDLAQEYLNLRGTKKRIEERMDAIKALLKQVAITGGTVDAKGSNILVENNYRVANEKYVKTKLSDEAPEVLKRLGIWEQVKKEVVDEDLLEKAYYSKLISEEDFAAIVQRDEKFRVMVEEIDETTGKTKREVNFGE